ncbi:MAG: hypothetical protein HYT83_00400 [Candidatus Levybacteria bacterium]|nr:hypothetical protein [Candidatus Levybacteria bacterium]
MTQERREQSQLPIRLSAAQQETAQAVLGTLGEVGTQRAVIVVSGLSGTGKTAMLESIAERTGLDPFNPYSSLYAAGFTYFRSSHPL